MADNVMPDSMTPDEVAPESVSPRPRVLHSVRGRVFNVGALVATISVLFWCGMQLSHPYEFVPSLRFVVVLAVLIVVHEALHVIALRVCGLPLAPYRFKQLGMRIGLIGPMPPSAIWLTSALTPYVVIGAFLGAIVAVTADVMWSFVLVLHVTGCLFDVHAAITATADLTRAQIVRRLAALAAVGLAIAVITGFLVARAPGAWIAPNSMSATPPLLRSSGAVYDVLFNVEGAAALVLARRDVKGHDRAVTLDREHGRLVVAEAGGEWVCSVDGREAERWPMGALGGGASWRIERVEAPFLGWIDLAVGARGRGSDDVAGVIFSRKIVPHLDKR